MKKNGLLVYMVILFAELTISGYLFYRQLVLLTQSNQAGDLCLAFALGVCDAALKNDYLFLALPLTAWGLLYFGLLLIFMVLSYFLKDNFKNEAYISSQLVTVVGGIVSLILLSGMALGKIPFCGLCLILHVLNFVLILMFWRNYPTNIRKLLNSLRGAFRYVLTGKSANPLFGQIKVLTFLLLAFMLISVYQRLNFEIKTRIYFAQFNKISENTTDNFMAARTLNIPVSNMDASMGFADAPVELIVFSDFECPYCADFAKEYKKWQNAYPDKIRLIFKHYPLSKSCNPVMEQDMHPQACYAAKAAQSALLQNKFWEFHDAMFEEGTNPELIQILVQRFGLDAFQFEKDLQSKEVEQKINTDITLANKLGISGTPSVFLNKRKIENLHPERIEDLIKQFL